MNTATPPERIKYTMDTIEGLIKIMRQVPGAEATIYMLAGAKVEASRLLDRPDGRLLRNAT